MSCLLMLINEMRLCNLEFQVYYAAICHFQSSDLENTGRFELCFLENPERSLQLQGEVIAQFHLQGTHWSDYNIGGALLE